MYEFDPYPPKMYPQTKMNFLRELAELGFRNEQAYRQTDIQTFTEFTEAVNETTLTA